MTCWRTVQGWSKEWDEWVEAPGLHKIDPATNKALPAPAGTEQPRDSTPAAANEGPGGEKRPASAAATGTAKRPEKKRKANDIAPQGVTPPAEEDEQAVSFTLLSERAQASHHKIRSCRQSELQSNTSLKQKSVLTYMLDSRQYTAAPD